MACTYMGICIFDFIIGPIINYVFFEKTGADFSAWKPLTLSEGGLFHLAMGAIIGVSAFTRGQEKMRRIEYSSPRDIEPYDDTRRYD